MLENTFLLMLDMSINATYAIFAVLIARLFLKNVPRVFSYVLWIVVLFRLLSPVAINSTVALLPVKEQLISETIINSINPYVNSESLEMVNNIVTPTSATSNTNINLFQDWIGTISTLWIIGIAVMLIFNLWRYVKFRRNLIGSILVKDNIYLSDYISTPLVVGVIKPRIYLPSTVEKNEREYIIIHEEHHIKRFDHVVRFLSFVALTLHFFNPIVWIAYIMSFKDMEMSCDEAVLNKVDNDIRSEYSQSLLKFTIGQKVPDFISLRFGEGETKGRVKNIMKFKKPMIFKSIITSMMIVLVITALITNPVDASISNNANLSIDGIKELEIGTKQVDIHKKIGEPKGTLSGMYGDIYEIEDKQIILYYDFDPANGYPLNEIKIVEVDNEVTISDFEQLSVGTKQADVRDKFGEPVRVLSGMYGDVYEIENTQIFIYYEFDFENGHPLSKVEILNKE